MPGRVHGGGRFPPRWFSAPDTQHSRLPCRHSTLIINTLTAPSPAQVEAVMQSVASHRTSVPAVISKALEQQLHAMRPDGCAVGAAAAAAGDDAVAPTGEGRHPALSALDVGADHRAQLCKQVSSECTCAHALQLHTSCLDRVPGATGCVLSFACLQTKLPQEAQPTTLLKWPRRSSCRRPSGRHSTSCLHSGARKGALDGHS